jgi:8-oxo-dGTP diphosphatase
MAPFKEIKIRVCAIIQCAGKVALIQRRKNGKDSYTIPGGNLDEGEDMIEGLRRELHEELGISITEDPIFIAVQDQMVSRPGATPPPRKIHMIFSVAIDPELKKDISALEKDELGEGNIVWIDMKQAAQLHLYPAAGDIISLLAKEPRSGPILLPAMTDKNFVWK